jgi:hypothetical protein
VTAAPSGGHALSAPIGQDVPPGERVGVRPPVHPPHPSGGHGTPTRRGPRPFRATASCDFGPPLGQAVADDGPLSMMRTSLSQPSLALKRSPACRNTRRPDIARSPQQRPARRAEDWLFACLNPQRCGPPPLTGEQALTLPRCCIDRKAGPVRGERRHGAFNPRRSVRPRAVLTVESANPPGPRRPGPLAAQNRRARAQGQRVRAGDWNRTRRTASPSAVEGDLRSGRRSRRSWRAGRWRSRRRRGTHCAAAESQRGRRAKRLRPGI